jgi:hypothetical protein
VNTSLDNGRVKGNTASCSPDTGAIAISVIVGWEEHFWVTALKNQGNRAASEGV